MGRLSLASLVANTEFAVSSRPTTQKPAGNNGGSTRSPVRANSDTTRGKTTRGKPVAVPTWVTGSYDPSLDLLYWGIGNPAPGFQGDVRPGDNLFTDSIVALHASSGKLAWYFQFTPHDEHDWDATQTPILADIPIKGVLRRVICVADRNGFYYVLDRVTGEFLVGMPFVEQNWATGLDSAGRPILTSNAEVILLGPVDETGLRGRS